MLPENPKNNDDSSNHEWPTPRRSNGVIRVLLLILVQTFATLAHI